MLLYALLIALASLGIIALARRLRSTPTHCRCGRPADIIDHARPWKVYCARCHLDRLARNS